jgi:hypothetical protein
MLQRSIRILEQRTTFNLYFLSRNDPLSCFPEENVPRIADGCNGLVWLADALRGHGERWVSLASDNRDLGSLHPGGEHRFDLGLEWA